MSAPRPTVVAIYNPASGSAPTEHDLRDELGPDVEIVETTEDDPGVGQARQAAEDGADLVLACGGDGTIRACLEGVAETGVPVGIVPLGTGNLLAANFGVPDGPAPAEEIARRPKRKIDLGCVNGEVFAVMAGTGFDARMIRDAERHRKSTFGRLAYVLAGIRNVPAALVPTTVIVDGKPWFSGLTSMVLVGNLSTVTGNLEVLPDADPADGRLDVGALRAATVRDWLTVLWNLLRNKPQPARLVRRAQGERVEVLSSRPRPYELDGEPRPPSRRLEITVIPLAVEIHGGGPDD